MTSPEPNYPAGVSLESRPCPNGCEPADQSVLVGQDRIHGIPGRFTVVRCQHCGLMRTDPRPTPQTIGAYYPADYAPHRAVDAVSKPKVRKWRHRFKDKIARLLGRDVRRLPPIEPGHMLEIGCASGAYLKEMRAQGWSVEGIEYSDAAAQSAREMGIHVQTASVETARDPERTADVATAWMVLEHLHDPVQALVKIRRWLKPDGYLVGVVPDANALDRRLFGELWYALQLPSHLYHYTPATLRQVLDTAGWELVQTRWQPNERNLLISLEWWLAGRNRPTAKKCLLWLKEARGARRLRRWLAWTLGVTHQSGRMEFWARPKRTQDREAKA
ncbi:Methyltransferase type 11 [Leptothrix cholodnii SP-6]|uniref:Methyltransferase type 11 n=1 Tax=Leptothrix cholodnii (strain ATCC 51168 / LMG 8142 / SP-6) TaxID=395495 RepID=B1Y2M7_LEPCP|nr:class I SAM-dependent methyltransferase [Leptothrix cholodnii]ACB33243.1 Methyltransferase type 11 [Leptothrix cholodnii SP-6]